MTTNESSQIEVSIDEKHDVLWKKFHSMPHEMMLNKVGRMFFPRLEYDIKGLVPSKSYAMALHIELASKEHYFFRNDNWVKEGKAYVIEPLKRVFHEAGVKTGEKWMYENVSFNFVRLTNDVDDEDPRKIFLKPCQMYTPVLTIYECTPQGTIKKPHFEFRVRHTEFIAVNKMKSRKMLAFKKNSNKNAHIAEELGKDQMKSEIFKNKGIATSSPPVTSEALWQSTHIDVFSNAIPPLIDYLLRQLQSQSTIGQVAPRMTAEASPDSIIPSILPVPLASNSVSPPNLNALSFVSSPTVSLPVASPLATNQFDFPLDLSITGTSQPMQSNFALQHTFFLCAAKICYNTALQPVFSPLGIPLLPILPVPNMIPTFTDWSLISQQLNLNGNFNFPLTVVQPDTLNIEYAPTDADDEEDNDEEVDVIN
ncbi:hypothetical protein CAEBREN_15824 [Caenorhabditis brenneri]|uniref:T-box domain-containing protein n=1 Tax=Caenorhabditis brenneri TaxID=135651 RepID=G0MBD4_CAEBE|nr:hypothetical protein CAEBREN_15824 [Caenorhabditis brenneri]